MRDFNVKIKNLKQQIAVSSFIPNKGSQQADDLNKFLFELSRVIFIGY